MQIGGLNNRKLGLGLRYFIRCGLLSALALGIGCKAKDAEDKGVKEAPPTGPVTVVGDNGNHPPPVDPTPTPTPTPTPAATADAGPPPAPVADIQSQDILKRADPAAETLVKHVLIGWKDLAPAYHGGIDPRAANRTQAEAAKLAKDVLAKLTGGEKIDALIKLYGEDPGSLTGDGYTVTPAAQLVPEFKQLGLRLKQGEAGIVQTVFGYHVIQRVAPPPPDPAESADILARKDAADHVLAKHILIGWKELAGQTQRPLDPRATARTKEEAEKLVAGIVKEARGKGDFDKLMAKNSEDSATAASGHAYEITPDIPMPDPFKNLALRLKMNEVGVVKTPFGYHIIKRVPPPPPDSLESADILARKPATESASVKHILLGWDKVNAGDPRGTKRSRADLEKLVKDTVAKLRKGDKIESLMAELSEDPGSAKSGNAYPVSPSAQLVEPFKNLSLRLKVGEVGVVKSDFGIHIIQRVQ